MNLIIVDNTTNTESKPIKDVQCVARIGEEIFVDMEGFEPNSYGVTNVAYYYEHNEVSVYVSLKKAPK